MLTTRCHLYNLSSINIALILSARVDKEQLGKKTTPNNNYINIWAQVTNRRGEIVAFVSDV